MMKRKKDLNTSIYNIIVLWDSKIDIFTDALKTINLTQNTLEDANDVKNVVETIKNQWIFSGIKEILLKTLLM